MFPAPGVYDTLTVLFVMFVSDCTTPLNRDMPAVTVTIPAETSLVAAVMDNFPDDVMVMPLGPNFMLFPFASFSSMLPGPSRPGRC